MWWTATGGEPKGFWFPLCIKDDIQDYKAYYFSPHNSLEVESGTLSPSMASWKQRLCFTFLNLAGT